MKMKKKAGATAARKPAAAKKKPAAKRAAPKKAARKPKAAAPAPRAEARSRAGTYMPQPVQGIGWAPFRYPPQ